jgi:hypothetical protein
LGAILGENKSVWCDLLIYTLYRGYTRTEYAFADVPRIIADEIGRPGFVIRYYKSYKPPENSLLQSFMRLVA